MTDFIREFFDSDMSEVHQGYIPSAIAAASKQKERDIYKELAAQLDKESLTLFEKYLGERAVYASEESSTPSTAE